MLIFEDIVKGGNHLAKAFNPLLTEQPSVALDHTGAPNKVATQCKLNRTFGYPLTAMLAFSVNQLPELQVMLNKTAPSVFLPADVVKKILRS